jgi:hypothetical protein
LSGFARILRILEGRVVKSRKFLRIRKQSRSQESWPKIPWLSCASHEEMLFDLHQLAGIRLLGLDRRRPLGIPPEIKN